MEKSLEKEIVEFLGLKPYERNCDRTDYQNGHYIRH